MSPLRAGLVLIAVAGCGSVSSGDGPDAAIDAARPPGTTTYRGTLAASPVASFGGMGFCNYTITLKQIELTVNVSTTGQVISASVQDLGVEATVPPCDFLPAPASIQKFTLKSATPTSNGAMLVMQGDAGNQPMTSLAITLTAGAGAYNAGARWIRTDQTPPLVWMVTANLTLTLTTLR